MGGNHLQEFAIFAPVALFGAIVGAIAFLLEGCQMESICPRESDLLTLALRH